MEKKDKKDNYFDNIREKIDVRKFSVMKLKKYFPFFEELKLTPKQIKFIVAYAESDFKTREAFRAAGYKAKNENTMDALISQTLRIVKVNEGLRKYIDARLGDTKKTLDQKLIDTLYRRAFYDSGIFFNEKGRVLPLDEIPAEWRCCIDGVERKFYGKDADTEVVVYKMADKEKSLNHLIKFMNIIKDDNNFHLHMSKETEDKLKDIFDRGREIEKKK